MRTVIRSALPGDIDPVAQGYLESMAYEREHEQYTIWQPGVYPTKETAEHARQNDSLFLLERDGEICASIIANGFQPPEYEQISWRYRAVPGKFMVIHLLCVHPSKARQGLGEKMVRFIIDKARCADMQAVRLDTAGSNKPAAALYRKMGFELAATSAIRLGGRIPDSGHLFFEFAL